MVVVKIRRVQQSLFSENRHRRAPRMQARPQSETRNSWIVSLCLRVEGGRVLVPRGGQSSTSVTAGALWAPVEFSAKKVEMLENVSLLRCWRKPKVRRGSWTGRRQQKVRESPGLLKQRRWDSLSPGVRLISRAAWSARPPPCLGPHWS